MAFHSKFLTRHSNNHGFFQQQSRKLNRIFSQVGWNISLKIWKSIECALWWYEADAIEGLEFFNDDCAVIFKAKPEILYYALHPVQSTLCCSLQDMRCARSHL